MARKPKIGIVALCDNVYKDEASNKIIIAGLYSGQVIAPYPSTIRLSLYIECYIFDLNKHEFQIEFILNNKSIGIGRQVMHSESLENPIAIIMENVLIMVSNKEKLVVNISIDSSKYIKILEKTIYSATSPTA